MKQSFLFAVLFLFVCILFVSAQIGDFLSPTRTPPEIKCGEDFFSCLAFFFAKILQIIIVGAIFLSVIFIAYAGFLYITKGGSPDERKKIGSMIMWAAWGLVVALLAFAFVRFLENVLRKPEEMILLPNYVYAQDIVEPPLPESLKCGPISLPSVLKTTQISGNFWQICLIYYIERILSLLYGLALALGVIFLSWAGLLYITNPQKAGETHKRLIFGIIGIVISVLSFTIVKIIDLFFLKL